LRRYSVSGKLFRQPGGKRSGSEVGRKKWR
jgi:hypothetical protein